jgi:hypothetical protein
MASISKPLKFSSVKQAVIIFIFVGSAVKPENAQYLN